MFYFWHMDRDTHLVTSCKRNTNSDLKSDFILMGGTSVALHALTCTHFCSFKAQSDGIQPMTGQQVQNREILNK